MKCHLSFLVKGSNKNSPMFSWYFLHRELNSYSWDCFPLHRSAMLINRPAPQAGRSGSPSCWVRRRARGASPLSSECQLVVGFGLSLTNCPLEPRRLLELLSKLSKISSQALFLDKMVHLKHHLDTSACGSKLQGGWQFWLAAWPQVQLQKMLLGDKGTWWAWPAPLPEAPGRVLTSR